MAAKRKSQVLWNGKRRRTKLRDKNITLRPVINDKKELREAAKLPLIVAGTCTLSNGSVATMSADECNHTTGCHNYG
jgi:hypothetical protein